MPHYYIQISDGTTVTVDLDGTEFGDYAHVRAEAVRGLCDIAADEVPRDGDRQELSVHVIDIEGHAVFSARTGFAVDAVAMQPEIRS